MVQKSRTISQGQEVGKLFDALMLRYTLQKDSIKESEKVSEGFDTLIKFLNKWKMNVSYHLVDLRRKEQDKILNYEI